jgi:hypothetical protein
MENDDPLAEALHRCAEYGGGKPMVIHVPEDAVIKPGPMPGPMLEGMVISFWPVD